MKYLKHFGLFNEGLFTTYADDEDIAEHIYAVLNKNMFFKIEFNGTFYIVKNIKLDENPGKYSIVCNKDILKLEYYKYDVLVFTKELDCSEEIKKSIVSVMETAFKYK